MLLIFLPIRYITFLTIPLCHPVFDGLNSQVLRVKRICSEPGDFVNNVHNVTGALYPSGSPNCLSYLVKALEKLERSDVLDEQLLVSNKPTAFAPEGPKIFYCITTHYPKNPPIRVAITTKKAIWGKTKTTRPLLGSKIVFGLQQNKTLSDQLVCASSSRKDEQKSSLSRNSTLQQK